MTGQTELPLWHQGDPDTSRLAALDNDPRAGTQREAVLRAIARSPGTAEDVATRLGWASGASGNSAAKRLSELKARGLVEPTGDRYRTSMGSLADEYRVTRAGADAITAHDQETAT
jgi:predicted ArsR family transcriptional regulator